MTSEKSPHKPPNPEVATTIGKVIDPTGNKNAMQRFVSDEMLLASLSNLGFVAPKPTRDSSIDLNHDDVSLFAVPSDFEEDTYLELNPDVAESIIKGDLASGAEHYKHYGRFEGRSFLRSLAGFDEETYLALHPAIAQSVKNGETHSGLGHYLAFGRAEGRSLAPDTSLLELMTQRLSVYLPADPVQYLKQYTDVLSESKSSNYALSHYAKFGWREGRAILSMRQIAKCIGVIASQSGIANEMDDLVPCSLKGYKFAVSANSNGSSVAQCLAKELIKSLRYLEAEVLSENENDVPSDTHTRIFVEPHEFFTVGRGRQWLRSDLISKGIMFNTDEFQIDLCERGLPFVFMSRAVIDVDFYSSRLISGAGIPVMHWVPDPKVEPISLEACDISHPLLTASGLAADRIPSDDFWARPIDVSYFGVESPKRELILSRLASTLADLRSYVYFRRSSAGPLNASNGGDALLRISSFICSHSKVTLCLPRDEFSTFDWFKVVRLGMCSGSVVLADQCLPVPTFVADEHYLACDPRHIPDFLMWLMQSEDGRRKLEGVRANAFQLLLRRAEEHPSRLRLGAFLKRTLTESREPSNV